MALLALGSLVIGGGVPRVAAKSPAVPVSGAMDRVEVHLVLVEVLVLDRDGRPVPGLGPEAFELTVNGRAAEIDTLDESCPTEQPDGEPAPASGPGQSGRRIALVFDKIHMPQMVRVESLRQARRIVTESMSAGDEILLATLGNGPHIEHGFSADPARLLAVLDRLERDPNYWARDFGSLTDRFFFDELGALMDVLAEYEGTKAAVLFSTLYARSDDTDTWFGDVATRAAAARVALYPVWAGGLVHKERAGGSPAMARLANESGGRFTRNTNDLTEAFARAHRDLACRYTLGFYVDAETSDEPHQVRVRVRRPGTEVRSPEWFRLPEPGETTEARARAALTDPERHDDPRIEIRAWPLDIPGPHTRRVLLAVRLPLEEPGPDAPVRLLARLERGRLVTRSFDREIDGDAIAAARWGDGTLTLLAEDDLAPGAHAMTVAVAGTIDAPPRSRRIEFEVADAAERGFTILGPVLARPPSDAAPAAVALDPTDEPSAWSRSSTDGALPTPVDGPRAGEGEVLLAVWNVCFTGDDAPRGATARRRLVDASGDTLRAWKPLPVFPNGDRNALCVGQADRVETGSLPLGGYRFEVAVGRERDAGTAIASGAAFTVR